MNVNKLDTPALLLNQTIYLENCKRMQDYANKQNVALRPHTKTHKMPKLAQIQLNQGACGITVAKVGEAEVMASFGVKDIFIANQIVGASKLERISLLSESINISFGIDSTEQVQMVEEVFSHSDRPARVLIEIEIGEQRSGVVTMEQFENLLKCIKKCKHVDLVGLFSHDGHSYGAKNLKDLETIHIDGQKRTLEFVHKAQALGFSLETVSIGSTPSLMHGFEILEGITEIRPGTYIFMDASQGNSFGSHDLCAATVLATVISKPTEDRVVLDVGAKGLTAQTRSQGLCTTTGLGLIKGYDNVTIHTVFDEHAIIYNRDFSNLVSVGDKVEIIPNHICPVVNLHETGFVVKDNKVIDEIEVACRGKLK